jgi:Flp pilus assembly protein TadG
VVEFVMIAPILMLIVLGIIQFARAWQTFQTITAAAHVAARTSAIADATITQDSVRGVVNRYLERAGMDSTIDVTTITGAWHAPGTVGVRIEYPFHMGWLQPMLNWTTGQSSISLKTEMPFRSEW